MLNETVEQYSRSSAHHLKAYWMAHPGNERHRLVAPHPLVIIKIVIVIVIVIIVFILNSYPTIYPCIVSYRVSCICFNGSDKRYIKQWYGNYISMCMYLYNENLMVTIIGKVGTHVYSSMSNMTPFQKKKFHKIYPIFVMKSRKFWLFIRTLFFKIMRKNN